MRLGRLVATGWLALLGLSATTVVLEYLPHTDDGCAVEVHCLACRSAASQTARTTAVLVVPGPAQIVEILPAPALPDADGRKERPRPSRGPPLV
jgi:hypothetical protein